MANGVTELREKRSMNIQFAVCLFSELVVDVPPARIGTVTSWSRSRSL